MNCWINQKKKNTVRSKVKINDGLQIITAKKNKNKKTKQLNQERRQQQYPNFTIWYIFHELFDLDAWWREN